MINGYFCILNLIERVFKIVPSKHVCQCQDIAWYCPYFAMCLRFRSKHLMTAGGFKHDSLTYLCRFTAMSWADIFFFGWVPVVFVCWIPSSYSIYSCSLKSNCSWNPFFLLLANYFPRVWLCETLQESSRKSLDCGSQLRGFLYMFPETE